MYIEVMGYRLNAAPGMGEISIKQDGEEYIVTFETGTRVRFVTGRKPQVFLSPGYFCALVLIPITDTARNSGFQVIMSGDHPESKKPSVS